MVSKHNRGMLQRLLARGWALQLLLLCCSTDAQQIAVEVQVIDAPVVASQSSMQAALPPSMNQVSSYQDAVSSVQIACPAGYYCIGGISPPIACPTGTYQPQPNSSAIDQCLVCPVGFFCPLATASPMPCAAGSYRNSIGAAAQSECTACQSGKFCSAGAVNPTNCTAGTYNPTAGSTSSLSCLPCPASTWSELGQSSCTLPCPVGMACSPAVNITVCKVCPPNQFVVDTCILPYKDTFCNTSCPPGMFGASYTEGLCRECPKGTYSDTNGMTTCISCPQATYANATRSTSCSTCPPLTFSDGTYCIKVCPYTPAPYLRHKFMMH